MLKEKQKLKNWKKVCLKDLLEIKGGKRLPRGELVQDKKTKYPYLRIVDMDIDGLSVSSIRYISEEVFSKISRYTISKNDIYISIAGTIGLVGKVSDHFDGANLTENCAKLCNLSEKLNQDYLIYFLRSEYGQSQIISKKAGTSQPKLALYRIGEIEVLLPPLLAQQKIASVLSAYDELIENNTKRIKILEDLAQSIYNEWFVKFRFPSYEKVKMVESKTDFGKIPEGWEVGIVNDILELKSGYTFKSDLFDEAGDYGLITIKNVQDGKFITECTNKIGDIPQNVPNHCYLADGDILLSLTGNVGRVCLVYGDSYLLNQRVAKLIPRENYYSFSYFMFRASVIQKKLELLSHGSAQQNLSPVETGNFKIVLPEKDIIKKFKEKTRPIIEQIILLNKINKNLRKTRDLLIPKLVSGEVEVK